MKIKSDITPLRNLKSDQLQEKTVDGFSRLSKEEKLDWVTEHFFTGTGEVRSELKQFWQSNEELQRVFDGFSENTISNYVLPYGVAPNFRINGKTYAVPMVIEESSVVAAASSAAKFWLSRGGFRAEVIDTTKLGQVHFRWGGDPARGEALFPALRKRLMADVSHLTENMEKRGGGVRQIQWKHLPDIEPDYYQLQVSFETCDSMGANFINSVLEQFGDTLSRWAARAEGLSGSERELQILMAILSNYTPDCRVRTWVSCPVEDLHDAADDMPAEEFARRFELAVRIAEQDPYRAVTHNKGILNGIDAVVLATANDFRAVEACLHAWAARDGQYRSLSHCELRDGEFVFEMDIPLSLGTVGGLTRLHPLARRSLEMLGNPSARELMQVVAATGLAQNFGAVRSLITTGIQHGHMKMHLHNILNHLDASEDECENAAEFFSERVVSYNSVREFLKWCRGQKETG